MTLRLIALLRLLFPCALIPATTALGTISPDGREKGIKAGANVVMANLTPENNRKKYLLYDNKVCPEEDSDNCRSLIERKIESIGYRVVVNRGNVKRI